MDDLISRSDAIGAVKEERFPIDSDYAEGFMAALDKVEWILKEWLPSAQPEPCEDTISRQDAIEAFAKMIATMCGGNVTWCKPIAESVISDLPSVQPEVIHCGECRYYKDVTSIHGDCECGEMWQSLFGEITEVEAINVHKDHYCGYAEIKYENDK